MDSIQNPAADKRRRWSIVALSILCGCLATALCAGAWWHHRAVDQLNHPRVPVGALVKGQASTVYYLGEDGKRWVIPTNHVFYSWFPDQFWVQLLPDESIIPGWGSMRDIPLGGNLKIRPGTYIIRNEYDNKLYWVAGVKSLRLIQTQADLVTLGGKDWFGAQNQPPSTPMIIDMPSMFMTNYGIDAPLPSNQLWCDGMLFRRDPAGEVYLIDQGAARLVTEEMMRANLFQDRFVRFRPDLPPLPEGPPLVDDSYLRSQLPQRQR